uniref:Regulator of chromosome condensation protein n=1 Tax=Pithovirus LCPAC401 TaxID=2506595 RepID=A0A481ZAF3_9VIRU|nr:MAG: regulator of chromosome condensation protein [Pithovirus LCPAC401]
MKYWKLLVKDSLNDLLLNIPDIYTNEHIQLFTDMSLRGMIVESAQIGRFLDSDIERNYISFSLPLELVESITDKLFKFDVICIVNAKNIYHLSEKIDESFHYHELGSATMFLGETINYIDLTSFPEVGNKQTQITRNNVWSIDVEFSKIDDNHYKSIDQYEVNVVNYSRTFRTLNDISAERVKGNIATITVIDAKWPNSSDVIRSYAFDITRQILPHFVNDINIDVEWYDECSNESDPILLEKLSDLDENDIIRVFLGDSEKGECYVKHGLRKHWRNQNLIMRNWIRTDRNIPIEETGYGGKPGTIRYYKLPLSGSWVTESTVNKLSKLINVIRLRIRNKNQLIGNRFGTFGVSEIHGQFPGEDIWEPKPSYSQEERKEGMTKNINPLWGKTVSAGNYHSVALKEDGSLISWGYDFFKQVFDTPEEFDFIQVSAGNLHSVALREDGSLISWGDDREEQISDTPDDSDFIQVSAGGSFSVALREDKSLISWGRDTSHREISDTPTNLDFIQVSAGDSHSVALRENKTIVSWGADSYNQVTDTPEGSIFIQVSAGGLYSVALREDGTLISWGHHSSDLITDKLITDTPSESDFIQVSAGSYHSVALREDGTLTSWGNDSKEQISDTPKDSNFIQVSAGDGYSVALREDGTLVSWGYDKDNQVSDTPLSSNF